MQMFWECINSLAPGRCSNIFNYVGFKHNIVIDIKNSFCEIVPQLFLMGVIDDKSILVWLGGTTKSWE